VTEKQFVEIKNRLHEFCFTSLKYTGYEEVEEHEILIIDDRAIIIYGYNTEGKSYEYHWACNNKKDLMKQLQKRNDKEQITFVPKDWVESIKNLGFDVYAIWNDYFADNLEEYANFEEPKYISQNNYSEASKVTLSCRGQSRGFSGQSVEWMKQWIENREPAAPDYVTDCVGIAEIEQEVIGVILIGIYGSGDGTTLWVREVAVKPEFQRKGIAKKLIGQAFAYGLNHGAKKAFLMADECNDNALHVYRKIGFKAGSDEGQIDMIR
jgi:ribosomal protein S18 acetylase RimI-like enzyme